MDERLYISAEEVMEFDDCCVFKLSDKLLFQSNYMPDTIDLELIRDYNSIHMYYISHADYLIVVQVKNSRESEYKRNINVVNKLNGEMTRVICDCRTINGLHYLNTILHIISFKLNGQIYSYYESVNDKTNEYRHYTIREGIDAFANHILYLQEALKDTKEAHATIDNQDYIKLKGVESHTSALGMSFILINKDSYYMAFSSLYEPLAPISDKLSIATILNARENYDHIWKESSIADIYTTLSRYMFTIKTKGISYRYRKFSLEYVSRFTEV